MGELNWTRIAAEMARLEALSPEDRRAAVAALPPDLKSEVESLLAALDQNPRFLETPSGAAASEIGPYRILEEIGRGGMGVVYRAQRSDGELDRQVALKLAGGRLFAPEAERRFIRERQILSRLDHPNIVRLLDGGVSRGQRYLVMDLVDGVPLTECAKNKPLEQRLRLFLDLCQAIHHAHQHLILHRDLKPANILVNREGVVKVLDFGIAQMLADEEGPNATQTNLHPLSLICASPEQMRGEPLSLASDIYSLGVLLYELATGRNPQYDSGAKLTETLRRVTEDLPPPPSRWNSALRRDFDAIVLKSLAKDPRRRYASVAELSADVERYLEGRPVLAVPPRWGYLFGRFVRRNKALSATAAALFLAVTLGAVVYFRQARIEQRRFEDARRLVHTVVFDLQPRMAAIPATLELRQTLVQETMRYLDSVSRDAGRNVALLREIGNSWVELGRIQGDGLSGNLGDRPAAAKSFAQAEHFLQRALQEEPRNLDLLLDAVHLYDRAAVFALMSLDRPQAQAKAKLAKQYAQTAQSIRPNDSRVQEALGTALLTTARSIGVTNPNLARETLFQAEKAFPPVAIPSRNQALTQQYLSQLHFGKPEGVAYARKAFQMSERILAANPENQRDLADLAIDAGQLASLLWNANQKDEGLKYFEFAYQTRAKIAATDPRNVHAQERLALSANNLAAALNDTPNYTRAPQLAAQAVSIYEALDREGKLAPEILPNFADALGKAGEITLRANKTQACQYLRRSAELWTQAEKRAPLNASRQAIRNAQLQTTRESCR